MNTDNYVALSDLAYGDIIIVDTDGATIVFRSVEYDENSSYALIRYSDPYNPRHDHKMVVNTATVGIVRSEF